MKKFFLATSSNFVKGLVYECAKLYFPHIEVVDVMNDDHLMFHLGYPEDNLLLIDKFFLGFYLHDTVEGIKGLNQKLRFVFFETGDCNEYFGLRVYNLGASGYIPDMKDTETLKQHLNKVMNGLPTFPEIVKDDIERGMHLDARYCGEPTKSEFKVAVLLAQNKSVKEIANETHVETHTVSNHIYWLKRKIGARTLNDYKEVYDQMVNRNVGGWNGCKS